MIPRHDNLRCWQAIQERSSGNKLTGPSALREIAGHRDQIRSYRLDSFHYRVEQCRVDAAEMQIGQVNQRAHAPIATLLP